MKLPALRRQPPQQRRQVNQPLRDQVAHLAAALHFALPYAVRLGGDFGHFKFGNADCWRGQNREVDFVADNSGCRIGRKALHRL